MDGCKDIVLDGSLFGRYFTHSVSENYILHSYSVQGNAMQMRHNFTKSHGLGQCFKT